jgi:TetR/AcrR family transcriptional regulator of autoinduction and epiphytic fitness
MSDVATETTSVDGRTARRDRNRDLVLDAVIDLFSAGTLAPTAADVAARSGVSLRSVYRYFEDQDELVRAAIARHAERIAPLLEVSAPGEGPLEERVTRFVAARMRLYEAAAPTARATLLRAPMKHFLHERMEWARATLREQTEAMFEPELAAMPATQRRAVSAAVDTLLQFESAEHLRVRLGLSPAQTADTLRRTLTTLLT